MFDPAACLSPALPREGRPTPKRGRPPRSLVSLPAIPNVPAVSGGVTAASLGIKRLIFERDQQNSVGKPGVIATILLSGGDGTIFTEWTTDCAPVTAADGLRCRAPDGCERLRLDGRSYCRRHHAIFYAPPPLPGGRPLIISAAANRKRGRSAPRLDLLRGM